MGKKKFIDKKQAATFQLIARDSSDPNYDDNTPGASKVFVRVDNSQYAVDDFFPEENGVRDSDSIFADADEDEEGVGCGGGIEGKVKLQEHVRKEILELGFPDDGYNYLTHLREIKNAGGGSAYYQNPKATVEPLPLDVKAYDASRVAVPRTLVEETRDEVIYSVAEKSVGVRLKKALDPEVAKLLDDDDIMSRFASDEEDLEEDFVVQANLADGVAEENEREELSLVHGCVPNGVAQGKLKPSESSAWGEHVAKFRNFGEVRNLVTEDVSDDEQQRVRRLLDDQFELLERQEYGSDDDVDDYYGGPVGEEVEDLADRLNQVLKDRPVEDIELGDLYKAPADLLKDSELPEEILKNASDLIRRCTEYAEKYENEDENVNVVIVEESSDESEVWDCDTIVSTYSNLDNHPGKIEAPGGRRQKPLRNVVDAVSNLSDLISLQGRERIPVRHSRLGKAATTERVNVVDDTKAEPVRRKNVGQETKTEKTERKKAIKEERKEARRAKKELKGLYKSETQRGQKAVAVSGPSTIHLI